MLERIDLTNNPFENFDRIGMSLATLPKLNDLKISLSSQDEAIAILSYLPNIEILNGKSTRYDTPTTNIDIGEAEIDSISLNNEISNFNVNFLLPHRIFSIKLTKE
jgi:hypothetical protein